jgi:intein/homing endonuclease
MNPGDPIWYRHVPRGGWGFGVDVPGEFLKATATRVVVRVFLKSGNTVDVTVWAKNVRPRDAEAVWR